MPLTLPTLALLTLGCRPHRSPAVPQVSGPETGTATGTAAPDRPWIPPSVQLHGQPNQLIHMDFVALPAHGGHPGTLFVLSGAQPEPYPQTFAEYPRTFLISGDLPRGVHAITDVWDGLGAVPFHDDFYPAGDVDHDGHMDAWCANRKLYRGPFLGRQLSDDQVQAEAECCWMPFLGNFDADGDGEMDALLGQGQNAQVYYGPFEGTLPLWGENPDITIFGHLESWDCTTQRGAFIVPGYFAPGQDAIVVGAGLGDDCTIDARFYELTGPRGRRLAFDDAFAEFNSNQWWVTRFFGFDMDGDGRSEVLWGQDRGLRVYENPVAPWIRDTPEAWDTGTLIADVVGDVNGDGHTDLVAWMDDDEGESWIGLVLGPFDTTRPIDETVAIPLTPTPYDQSVRDEVLYYNGVGEEALDLDGDGLTDLIDLQPGPDNAGYISIWYGADLVAAIDQWSAR